MTAMISNSRSTGAVSHGYKIAILGCLWLASVCGLGYLWLSATGTV